MSKFRSALLPTVLFAVVSASQAQTSIPKVWDLYGGVAVLRSASAGQPEVYTYGWDASLSQRYETHPWVGGTIEASAVYTQNATVAATTAFNPGSSLYTAMAGPVVTTTRHTVRGFAHALFGAVIINQPVTPVFLGDPTNTWNDYFGQTLGGGLDVPVRHHTYVRAQADWLRVWRNSGDADTLRLTGGIVYNF